MKKTLQLFVYIITLLFCSMQVHGQGTTPKRICATEVPEAAWEDWFSQKVVEYTKNKASGITQMANYNIPLVVHILHNGDAVGSNENISLAQVQSQINILNADFSGTNADIGNVPAVFAAAKAGNTGISFCLAKVNPSGATLSEVGVDRINWQARGWQNPNSFYTIASFKSFMENTVKPNTIWDPKKYMNIWVVDMDAEGLLGYATFPAGSNLSGMFTGETATTSGVVMNQNAFGNIGTAIPPYNKGRVATHEVGHWLGLRHIWGDGTCKTDYCGDTPPAYDKNFGCPTHPHNLGFCQGNTTGEMFMNYMDYTSDDCKNMFTRDQMTRMQTAMQNGTYRSTLPFSNACDAANSTPAFNLKLYDYVTPSATSINYGSAFSVSTNIANFGTGAFSGDYCAAVFDNTYQFVDFVEIKSNNALAAGYAYSSNLQFTNPGILEMVPGNYFIGIFSRPPGGTWTLVSDNVNFKNLVPLSVVNEADMELYSPITITNGGVLKQGQTATVNLDIANTGATTFVGQYQVNLYQLDGLFAETIGTISESTGLGSGYHYSSPYLNFTTNAIVSKPGSYLLVVQTKKTNGSWIIAGASYYPNPIKVTIQGPNPDIYEANNGVAQAYSLPLAFSSNNAAVLTTGANLHVATDSDFYKINLPAGYNYSIRARAHDSYNASNGNVYSADVLFSYSKNAGTNWFGNYDDTMPKNLVVSGGSTLYFKVGGFFEGMTGTYLLDVQITRTPYQFLWTGEFNSDWNNVNNWSAGRLPTNTDDIIIKAGTPFSPIIANGVTGICRSIKAETGASVNVATGGRLNVTSQ